MLKIQSTFVGYGGSSCSLFSLYDNENGLLVFSVQAEYRAERRDGCAVITNDPRIDRDRLFADDDIKVSLSAYYQLKSGVSVDGKSARLTYSDSGRAAMANPESSIEKDGIDVGGPRFRIADSVTCGQMAALATCLYAIDSDVVDRAVSMADELQRLLSGEVVTI